MRRSYFSDSSSEMNQVVLDPEKYGMGSIEMPGSLRALCKE
ncbi:hypothetical protein Plim_0541 [Planctopirus limnophila DSM 3776]|uniref:Uncharacterized protein n=1 Tax=Planctopirus limnophila (strain ATCC 43296 / DSM 3776 / IFAM 1008 / Mu 290) TaxID=521674 RepID=D5SQD7_PLAL2|nr:hypothetical protein Plim_0541 [Planctopirus limnophila DSM 3776]